MRTTGDRYAEAIRRAQVRYVVNLSSIGAHLPHGPGPTGANYYVEQVLNQLPGARVLHLRPGMFYSNFFGAMDMMRAQNIMGHNFDASISMLLSHPHDIADIAAEAFQDLSFTHKSVCYIVGDEQNGGAIASQLGNAIGNPDLAWIQFPDEAMLQGMLQNGLSEQMATVYVLEIGEALRNDVLFDDYRKNIHPVKGRIRLTDFAQEFAHVYTLHGKKTIAQI